jgi:preprotein translocase subunit YajC
MHRPSAANGFVTHEDLSLFSSFAVAEQKHPLPHRSRFDRRGPRPIWRMSMDALTPALVAQAGGGLGIDFIVMTGLMFVIFYFMLIRPQRKRERDHQTLLAGLKRGDEVILSSGIFARIHAVEATSLVVEIAEKTRVKILKSAVTGLTDKVAAKALEAPIDDTKTKEALAGEATETAEKKSKK